MIRPDYDQFMRQVRLSPVSGGLAFVTPYNPALISELKRQIPPEGRKWDGQNRRWLVDSQYGSVCVLLAERYCGVKLRLPSVAAAPTNETRLLKVEYLGQCKERDNGEFSAFGWADGGWTVIVAESVLREWFSAVPQAPGEAPTLFAVLGIKQDAAIDEIRKNYRRLARQWHPDVCADADATEQFRIIQHAYEVLSNEGMRRKYVAGLALQQSLPKPRQPDDDRRYNMDGQLLGYRSPLRCGWVLAEGRNSLGRFIVAKLLQWEDITDEFGRVAVASWPMGTDKPEVKYA